MNLLLSLVTVASAAAPAGPAPAEARCPVPRQAAELEAALDAAERAWADQEDAAVRSASDTATTIATCIGAPLPPALVARYDRVLALRAFLDKDDARGRAFCLAAQRIDPGYHWPDALFPPGHPRRAMCEAAPSATPAPLPRAMKGWTLYVDGTPTAARPDSLPAFLQVVDGAGSVRANVVVLPTDGPPCYPHRGDRLKKPLAAVALAAAAGSAAGFAAAFAEKGSVSPAMTGDELEGAWTASNALEAAGWSLGGVALMSAAADVALHVSSPTCR